EGTLLLGEARLGAAAGAAAAGRPGRTSGGRRLRDEILWRKREPLRQAQQRRLWWWRKALNWRTGSRESSHRRPAQTGGKPSGGRNSLAWLVGLGHTRAASLPVRTGRSASAWRLISRV